MRSRGTGEAERAGGPMTATGGVRRPGPRPRPGAAAGRVWYAAYASNMSLARLTCYLAGGRLPGGDRDHPGSRDRRPPAADVPLLLPGRLHFALESSVWGGGMGFYDPGDGDGDGDDDGEMPARGYLLTTGQFLDVLAQERRRTPGDGPDPDLRAVLADGRALLGPDRYETVLCVGGLAGRPVLTFTAPWRRAEAPLNAPTAAYLRVLAAGLREAHGWDTARSAAYLSSRPGAAGAWSADGVARVLAVSRPLGE